MRTLWGKVTLALTLVLVGGVPLWAKPLPAEVQAKVREWYARYLGRAPEPGALDFWGQRLLDTKHPVDVEASILASPEYYDKHGRNPASFVRALYRDVVGYEPESGQVDFWVGKAYELRERDKLLREFMAAARKQPARLTTPTIVPPAPGPVRPAPASANPARGTPTQGTPKGTVPPGYRTPLPAYQSSR